MIINLALKVTSQFFSYSSIFSQGNDEASHQPRGQEDEGQESEHESANGETRAEEVKTMMQTKEVKDKKKKVRIQQGTTREMQLTTVSGSVTFVTSAAGLEVIFADQKNASNS